MSYSIHNTKAAAERARDLHAKALGMTPPNRQDEVYQEWERERWYYPAMPDEASFISQWQPQQYLNGEERAELLELINAALPELPPDWNHEPPPEEDE